MRHRSRRYTRNSGVIGPYLTHFTLRERPAADCVQPVSPGLPGRAGFDPLLHQHARRGVLRRLDPLLPGSGVDERMRVARPARLQPLRALEHAGRVAGSGMIGDWFMVLRARVE